MRKLSKKWGSPEGVFGLARRGREKVRKIAGDDRKKYEDLVSTEMRSAI